MGNTFLQSFEPQGREHDGIVEVLPASGVVSQISTMPSFEPLVGPTAPAPFVRARGM